MSEATKIAWADSTASPWFGCTEVSPGCVNCYARELTLKRKWAGWGDNAPRMKAKGFWKEIPKWNREAEPMVKRSLPGGSRRPRIFPSLMDWLDPKVPIEWLADFLKVIHDCQNLDFLLLTKRPELFNQRGWSALFELEERDPNPDGMSADWLRQWLDTESAPNNVWLGVTCEDQKRADERIPELLKIPARVRFLSCEPLLERVNLTDVCSGQNNHFNALTGKQGWLTVNKRVDWVIVGGESGSKRRDCGWEAIGHVAEQCRAAGVPVFVKQDCAAKPGQQGRIPEYIWRLKQFPTV